MKNLRKKSISLVLIFTMLMAIFMPTMVNALSYDLPEWNETDRLINSYNITSDVVTLYVGNISVDGTSTIKYLYTDKSVNTNALTEIRKILTSDYASLLPTTAGQVAVSNDSSVTVNDIFTDAGMVAINKYPSGTVSDTSSTILYNQTQFNSLATASQAEISAEATAEANNLSAWNTRKSEWDAAEQVKANEDSNYIIKDFPETYVNAFNDSTAYPTTSFFMVDNKGESATNYRVINARMTQVDTYPIARTIIKVVNTSANVTMPASLTPINSLNINVASPKVGDTVTSSTKPNVTIDSNPNYEIDHIAYITAYPSEKPMGEYDMPFTGTFEDGKEYYVEVSLHAKDGYVFRDNNNITLKVNGKTTGYEMSEWNSDNSPYYMFYTKVSATSESEETTPTTYEYIDNTADQTYTINKDDTLTFRINADYSLFENGGKVYVDGTETTEYTSKSGSTIITLNKDYVNSLSVGEHTLKVAFNNGGEATTKFTIAKAEETTPTETTPTDNSKNPKTGDNIIMTISIFAIATLGAYTTLKVNRSRKMRKH